MLRRGQAHVVVVGCELARGRIVLLRDGVVMVVLVVVRMSVRVRVVAIVPASVLASVEAQLDSALAALSSSHSEHLANVSDGLARTEARQMASEGRLPPPEAGTSQWGGGDSGLLI